MLLTTRITMKMRSKRSTPVDVASPTIRFSPDMRDSFLSGTVIKVIAPQTSTATLTGKARQKLTLVRRVWWTK